MNANFSVPSFADAASGNLSRWGLFVSRYLSRNPLTIHIQPKENQRFAVVFHKPGAASEDLRTYLSTVLWYKLGYLDLAVEATRVTLTDALLEHFDTVYKDGDLRTRVTPMRHAESKLYSSFRNFVFQPSDIPLTISQQLVNEIHVEKAYLVLRQLKAIWLKGQTPEAATILERHIAYEPKLIEHVQALEKTLRRFSHIKKARGYK